MYFNCHQGKKDRAKDGKEAHTKNSKVIVIIVPGMRMKKTKYSLVNVSVFTKTEFAIFPFQGGLLL